LHNLGQEWTRLEQIEGGMVRGGRRRYYRHSTRSAALSIQGIAVAAGSRAFRIGRPTTGQ